MHKQRSKRAEFWRLFLLFTVFPLSIIALSTLSVLYVIGYRFNTTTHEVAQGGLIQFDSRPRGAQVSVDGQALGGRTATKLDTTAGTHTVTMVRDGYLPWQKTVTVDPGVLLWLNYARLIPEDLTVKTLDKLSPDDVLAVRGTQLMYWLADDTKPSLTYLKANDDGALKTKSLTIPSGLYTAVSGAHFDIKQADPSGRYLLIDYIRAKKTLAELMIDTESLDDSVNLSKVTSGDIGVVQFDPSHSHRLNMIIDDDYRQYRADHDKLGPVVVKNVAEIHTADSGIVTYVSQPDKTTHQRTVGYVSGGSTVPKVLRTFYGQGDEPLQLVTAPYSRARYYALKYGQTLEVGKADLPSSGSSDSAVLRTIATISLPKGSNQLSTSPSGRFVLIKNGTTYTTYDFQLKKLSMTSLRGDGDHASLVWLDDTSLLSDRGGTLQYYEFDGENSHTLLKDVALNQAVLSSNNRYMYAWQTQSGKTALVTIRLILD